MATIKALLEKKKSSENTNKADAVKTPIAEKEKIEKFVNNLPVLLANRLQAIIDFFKARPMDVYFLGYDKECRLYGTSVDSKVWKKLTKSEMKFSGYVPVPERGTIWQSRNSKALFIVLDFINCQGILQDGEHPSILYMNELGNTRACKIVDWQGKFIFCDHTVGKN